MLILLLVILARKIFLCRQATGFVRNSVVSNVRCKYIEAEGCVLINVTAERIIARPGSIIYNFVEGSSGAAEPGAAVKAETNDGDVIVGVFDESGKQTVVRSHMDTDGGTLRKSFFVISLVYSCYSLFNVVAVVVIVTGKVWDDRVAGNHLSFAEVYNINSDVCPTSLQKIITITHEDAWSLLQL